MYDFHILVFSSSITENCCIHRYDAVIHFAGLKAVGESVARPFLYYDNNLVGTINLYEFMAKNGCKKVFFTSNTCFPLTI